MKAMIKSGVDLVPISRIEKSIKNPRFIEKVFSPAEQELFESRKFSPATIAANFAGKEAFSKSLGTGVRGFSLNEVEILRDELGCPYIRLLGKAKQAAESKGLQFSVSLSHTDTDAVAFVVAYSLK
ncbi:MAG: acpS [Oscillospiraceae bacterium]|jgi:holo-[acyl-carrier protein] synthase|nr:acpS [Oscillospiraceae bacterium]